MSRTNSRVTAARVAPVRNNSRERIARHPANYANRSSPIGYPTASRNSGKPPVSNTQEPGIKTTSSAIRLTKPEAGRQLSTVLSPANGYATMPAMS